jgi:hypothetical protein
MPEQPWERQQGESTKAFTAFECYRMLGPERSLQAAWEKHSTRPGTLRERQQNSTKRARHLPGYWGAWASKWCWTARAAAWDEQVAALARDQELDRALQARAAEQEEELRQHQLMREEARAARTVGRRLLMRILQGVEAGQLDQMAVPDLLPHLQKVSGLLEVGQKLERLFAGQPSDITRQQTEAKETVDRLVALMQEFVAPERWGELAERIGHPDAEG